MEGKVIPQPHVPFARHFVKPSDDELKDLSSSLMATRLFHSKYSWSNLLELKRVVVLGQGRCGKTHEFKKQTEELQSIGKPAFFVPLEVLHDHNLEDALTAYEEERLIAWQNDEAENAYFFLDSVDELKLRKGSFRAAIRKLSGSIGHNAHRLHLYVSCRPKDWDTELDKSELQRLKVPVIQVEKDEEVDGDTLLASIVSENISRKTEGTEKSKSLERGPETEIFLLPGLSGEEAVNFSQLYKPELVSLLRQELDGKDLWHLYDTPAALIDALDQLGAEGRLGTLDQQLERSISKRLDERSESRSSKLSVEKARQGVERLALALSLTKKRTFYIQRPGDETEGLDLAGVLSDWTAEDQRDLVGRPLFRPVGIKLFDFDSRPIQEYLAAKRLQHLRGLGLSTRDLFQILFGRVLDQNVAIPSLEPITAWLALWNADILKQAKEANPLLLFKHGLPALMGNDLCADLLRLFVAKYSNSDWRGIGIEHGDLRRLARPQLSPIVRELWDLAYRGYHTRETLLELIFVAPMTDCLDLALNAAFDPEIPIQHRKYACWAVFRSGSKEQKEQIAKSLLNETWPYEIVWSVIPDLLTGVLTANEFIKLVKRTEEKSQVTRNLSNALIETFRSAEVPTAEKIKARDAFVEAIWDTRDDATKIYSARSSFDHFADPIVSACAATIPTDGEATQPWAWSLVIAFHFGDKRHRTATEDDLETLREELADKQWLREGYFWACCDLVKAVKTPDTDWKHFVSLEHDSFIHPMTESDISWLLAALENKKIGTKRGVAFYALRPFLNPDGTHNLAETIRKRLSDRPDLIAELDQILKPHAEQPDQHEIEHRKWEQEREAEQQRRVEDWQNWRSKVLSDPLFRLDETHQQNTLENIYQLSKQEENDHSSWGAWNPKLISELFSDAFLEELKKTLQAYWRRTEVKLWSEREAATRNSFENAWIMALMAVKSEADNNNAWCNTLTRSEATGATRIALLELNGFAAFLSQLEEAQPEAVGFVMQEEIVSQLDQFVENEAAPILQDLSYRGSEFVKTIAAQVFGQKIRSGLEISSNCLNSDLEHGFKILSQFGKESVVAEGVKFVVSQLDVSPSGSPSVQAFWLKILARLDLASACEALIEVVSAWQQHGDAKAGVQIFASVCGDRHAGGQPDFSSIDEGARADKLKRLVLCAYQTVNPEEDVRHEGAYTPDTRDDAESARGFLFNNLVGLKSTDAILALRELSTMEEFAHMRDRLDQLAMEITAELSEPKPMTISAFRSFDQSSTYIPFDDQSLFAVLSNRLADFQHFLLEDEFSPINTFRQVTQETELRRLVANWLNNHKRGAYFVDQEAVKIGENRTDIRLYASQTDKYAAIELKLDDKRNRWSGADLKSALVDQLVGKYLSHERCFVGALLICLRETRRWQNPDTREMMDLPQTVRWLQSIADGLMAERPELHVLVYGLDYTTD